MGILQERSIVKKRKLNNTRQEGLLDFTQRLWELITIEMELEKLHVKISLLKVLARFSMLDVKPKSPLLSVHSKLSSQLCPSSYDDLGNMSEVPYVKVVGCPMYLMVCTRPDFSHAIKVGSMYMEDSGKGNWNVVIKVDLQISYKDS